MNCPQCQHPDVDGRNFCGSCGERLRQNCRQCGFPNWRQDRFCGGCGVGLDGAAEQSVAPAAAAKPPRGASRAAPAAEPATRPPSPMAELLEAARESERVEKGEGDIKVSQNDIDSLFGD